MALSTRVADAARSRMAVPGRVAGGAWLCVCVVVLGCRPSLCYVLFVLLFPYTCIVIVLYCYYQQFDLENLPTNEKQKKKLSKPRNSDPRPLF